MPIEKHPRQLVREQIAQAIKDYAPGIPHITDINSKVFVNRIQPVFPAEMPAIHVYQGPESNRGEDTSPTIYQRYPSIIVELLQKSEEDGDVDSEYERGDDGKVEEGFWFSHTPSLGSLQACASYAG